MEAEDSKALVRRFYEEVWRRNLEQDALRSVKAQAAEPAAPRADAD